MHAASALPAGSAFLGTPFCPVSLEELYETVRAEKNLKRHEQPSLPALLSAAAKAARQEASKLVASARRAKRSVSADTRQLAEDSRKSRRTEETVRARKNGEREGHAAPKTASELSTGTPEERRELQDVQRQSRLWLLQEGARRAERLASEALVAAQGAETNAEIGAEHAGFHNAGERDLRRAVKGALNRAPHAVGSAEDWTPQSFCSSRQDRRMDGKEPILQRPEDFMDEEDLQVTHSHTPRTRRRRPSSYPSTRSPEPVSRALPARQRTEEREDEREEEEREDEREEEEREDDREEEEREDDREEEEREDDREEEEREGQESKKLKFLREALEREKAELAQKSEMRLGTRGDSESADGRWGRDGKEGEGQTALFKRTTRPQLPQHLEELRRLQKELECMREQQLEAGDEGRQQRKGERPGVGGPAEEREEARHEAKGQNAPDAGTERRSGDLEEREKGERRARGEDETKGSAGAMYQGARERRKRNRTFWGDGKEDREFLEKLLRALLTEEERESERIAELHREAQDILLIAAAGKDASDEWLNILRAADEAPKPSDAASVNARMHSSFPSSLEGERAMQVSGGDALKNAARDVFVIEDSDDEDRLIFEANAYRPENRFAAIAGGGPAGSGERGQVGAGRQEALSDNSSNLDIGQFFCLEKKEQTETSGWFPPPAPPAWFDGVYRPPVASAAGSFVHAGVARLLPRLRGDLLSAGEGRREETGEGDSCLRRQGRPGTWRATRSCGILARESSSEKAGGDEALSDSNEHSELQERESHLGQSVPQWQHAQRPRPSALPSSPSSPSASTSRRLPLWQGVSEEDRKKILFHLFGGEENGREQGAEAREMLFSWSREKRKLPQWTREGELFPQAAHLERHQKQQLQRRRQDELEQKWRALHAQIRDVRKEIEKAIKTRPDKRMRWELFVGRIEKEEAEAKQKHVETSFSTSIPRSRSLPPSASSSSSSPSSSSPSSSSPSSSSSSLPVPGEWAGCAAEAEKELDEFRSWHRRLSLLRGQLAATRKEAAARAAEAWREGTFEVRLGEASPQGAPGLHAAVGGAEDLCRRSEETTSGGQRNGRRSGDHSEAEQGAGETKVKWRARRVAPKEEKAEAEEEEQTLTLESMLPLLSSRRTAANWAPNPTLCHRLGIPNPWARMPFFDDRKPTSLPAGHEDLVFRESVSSSVVENEECERETWKVQDPVGSAPQPFSMSVEAELTTVKTHAVAPGCPRTNLFRAVFKEDPSDSSEVDEA
ncbi:UNVERIFIED_CONTAM: hypothetical protein HHA_308070 [Hammondia hammondi]|eukprot:XP_008889461.1 hypothetical protein HHA_308070 [Hammondia hammondi]